MSVAEEFVKAVYPSARIRREGIKVMIVRSSNGIAGWIPISGMHYSEADAWNEAQEKLPYAIR